jgi:hypothetical protein
VDEEEKEKTAFSPLVDTICVFIIGTEQGGVFMFEPRGNQLNRIFQANHIYNIVEKYRKTLELPFRRTAASANCWTCQGNSISWQSPME